MRTFSPIPGREMHDESLDRYSFLLRASERVMKVGMHDKCPGVHPGRKERIASYLFQQHNDCSTLVLSNGRSVRDILSFRFCAATKYPRRHPSRVGQTDGAKETRRQREQSFR